MDAADWKNNYYGTVEVRSAATGTVLRNITVSQGVNGEPVISDGRLYFGTGNWTLCGNTTSDPHCPVGHVYAYGIPLKDVPATPILLPSSQCISSFPVQYSSAATGGMPGLRLQLDLRRRGRGRLAQPPSTSTSSGETTPRVSWRRTRRRR